ncbi:MAG TPA: hypothetical protein VE953_17005 [Terriglobales bacterium]|nr:hypothetical protein [Terriglobales bacterium]
MRTVARRPSTRSVTPRPFTVERDWLGPDDPVLCVVWERDGETRALVNAAHGLVGYDHAAYHAAVGLGERVHVCRLGESCGYAGVPEANEAPPDATGRACHLRPV